MTDPAGNSEFFFPENLNVSLDFVSENIKILLETKFTVPQGNSH